LRANCCHRAYSVTAPWAAIVAVLLLSLCACRPGSPIVDNGAKPTEADGTISGTVRGPEGTSSIEGRIVEVVNVATGARQRVLTSNTGGFTFKVKPGKYRIELTLHDGEKLVKGPGELDVNRSDVDAQADFVLGASTILRPRYHAPRADDGLGSAIA
jgi:carboxypeptidase family protein